MKTTDRPLPPMPTPQAACIYGDSLAASEGWRWYASTSTWERVCARHATRDDYVPDEAIVWRQG
ncbi:hypothetical protein ACWDA3_25985 [Nonomuraea rubra]